MADLENQVFFGPESIPISYLELTVCNRWSDFRVKINSFWVVNCLQHCSMDAQAVLEYLKTLAQKAPDFPSQPLLYILIQRILCMNNHEPHPLKKSKDVM